MGNDNLTEEKKALITEELAKQLILLSTTSGKACTDFLDDSNKQNDEIAEWHKAIMKITQAKKSLGQDSTFLDASLFLSAYEVTYVSILDRICYLYIKNGHDLYDSMRNKFARNFEEIGKLNTFTKFQFLKEHDLSKLIREKDNELRNKIAHLDFTIENEGKIRVQNNVINLNDKLVELYNFSADIIEALNKAVNNLTADLKRRTEELNKKTEELNRRFNLRAN